MSKIRVKFLSLEQTIGSFQEDNEYYVELMERYEHSDILSEVLLFMRDFNPEFAKEKELGNWSAEFLLNIISSNEDTWGQEDSLKNLYMDIAESYKETKFQYQHGRSKGLISLFEEHFEAKYPNDDDWDDEIYDREFEAFSKRNGETESYLFEISHITID